MKTCRREIQQVRLKLRCIAADFFRERDDTVVINGSLHGLALPCRNKDVRITMQTNIVERGCAHPQNGDSDPASTRPIGR